MGRSKESEARNPSPPSLHVVRINLRNAGRKNAVFVGHANFLPNVQDEPPPQPARLVLLGARDVTAVVVGSGGLFGTPGTWMSGVTEAIRAKETSRPE
jgi:hypothetical protein